MVCHFLEPCLSPVGWPFTEWPACIAVVPWFKPHNIDLERIYDETEEAACHVGPASFTITGQVLSKTGQAVSVIEVADPKRELHTLHDQIVVSLGLLGCIFLKEQILEHYVPHISQPNHGQGNPAVDPQQLCNLAIVGNSGNNRLKQVLKTIELPRPQQIAVSAALNQTIRQTSPT